MNTELRKILEIHRKRKPTANTSWKDIDDSAYFAILKLLNEKNDILRILKEAGLDIEDETTQQLAEAICTRFNRT